MFDPEFQIPRFTGPPGTHIKLRLMPGPAPQRLYSSRSCPAIT